MVRILLTLLKNSVFICMSKTSKRAIYISAFLTKKQMNNEFLKNVCKKAAEVSYAYVSNMFDLIINYYWRKMLRPPNIA